MLGGEKAGNEPAQNPKQRWANVELPMTVHILVEEETFSPFVFDGTCQDINRTGALILVRDLTKESYAKMIHKPRYVRATCQLPGAEQPIMFFGKLVGYDYKSDATSSICKLAVAFEPMKNEDAVVLDRYLASRSSPFLKPS